MRMKSTKRQSKEKGDEKERNKNGFRPFSFSLQSNFIVCLVAEEIY